MLTKTSLFGKKSIKKKTKKATDTVNTFLMSLFLVTSFNPYLMRHDVQIVICVPTSREMEDKTDSG